MEQAPKPAEAAPAPSKGRRTWIVVGAVVIIVVVVLGLYFAGYLTPSSEGTPVHVFERPSGSCSSITNCNFTPTILNVTTNAKVTWTNNSTSTVGAHTVTTDPSFSSPASFDSGTLVSGQKFSYTFSIAGTYHYYCVIHPFMKAEVRVAQA